MYEFASWPLGYFSFYDFFAWFAELSTAKTRINLRLMSYEPCSLGLGFEQEPMHHTLKQEVIRSADNLEKHERDKEAWQ